MYHVTFYVLNLPLFELRIDDSAGESFSANTNSFKYTVTLQLVQDKCSINDTCKQEKITGKCHLCKTF